MSSTVTRIRLVAVAAAAGIALLAGCSSPTPSDKASAASCAPAKGKVTLQYWNTVPGMDQVVALWNKKNPDIQVQSKNISNDQYGTIGNALKAGKAPDLAQVGYDELPAAAHPERVRRRLRLLGGQGREVEVRAVDLVAGQLRQHRCVRLPAGHRADGPLRAQ